MRRSFAAFTISALSALALAPAPARARITRIELAEPAPAFEIPELGDAGKFEKLVGTAYGEVDPTDPRNAIIQDIELAPRNARGMVEYSTDVYILKPVHMETGNGMLLYAVTNRGAKGGIPFNIGVRSHNQAGATVAGGNDPFDPGDGFLQKMGYTIVWSGWQPDVLPGNFRMTAVVPVAKTVPTATNPEGVITGTVRSEISLGEGVAAPQPLPVNLSAGRFTLQQEATYEPVDIATATLTQRRHVNDPRVPIDRISPDGKTVWSILPCSKPPPGTHFQCQIRLAGGFQPGVLYELTYTAKNPTVLGLGWAAQRDLVSFLKHAEHDEAPVPHANPLFTGKTPLAVVQGISQSGRAIRTFLHLGFNEDEQGRIVFEGAFPQIGGGRVAMNVRFGTPARGWGYSVDHLYPAYEFPFSYMPTHDPITRRTAGILDRCLATETCPKIFHVASALELWEGRQSLGLTDTLGKRDLGQPGFIRFYIMASTEHSPPEFDAKTGSLTFADCEQQQNPNPQTETLRALWVAFTQWVKDGVQPPPSEMPRVKDGTLVPPAAVKFPAIPANKYRNQRPAGPGPLTPRVAVRFEGLANELHPLDFGKDFNPLDESGIVDVQPPRESGATYGVLVPQVDADGNDLAGIRSVTARVPLATYTGWNMGVRENDELGRPPRFGDGLCPLSGSYIPFAPTDADRVPGDERRSIQARYGTHDGYVTAVRAAAESLVSQRFLLREDADRLVAEAEAGGVLR